MIALDPETGREIWKFDPEVSSESAYVMNCRGVSTWLDQSAPTDAVCRRRIIMGTVDARMLEVDARTGVPCSDFGSNGQIDLREGLGEVRPGEYGVTSPPVILGDLIITGALVLDDVRVDAPGGVVRAFDVRTGALRWSWDPVPPGDVAAPETDGARANTVCVWFQVEPNCQRRIGPFAVSIIENRIEVGLLNSADFADIQYSDDRFIGDTAIATDRDFLIRVDGECINDDAVQVLGADLTPGHYDQALCIDIDDQLAQCHTDRAG